MYWLNRADLWVLRPSSPDRPGVAELPLGATLAPLPAMLRREPPGGLVVEAGMGGGRRTDPALAALIASRWARERLVSSTLVRSGGRTGVTSLPPKKVHENGPRNLRRHHVHAESFA